MNELLINVIVITIVLLSVVVAIITLEAWSIGCDYVHDVNFTTAIKLNRLEKLCDGFTTLLKM